MQHDCPQGTVQRAASPTHRSSRARPATSPASSAAQPWTVWEKPPLRPAVLPTPGVRSCDPGSLPALHQGCRQSALPRPQHHCPSRRAPARQASNPRAHVTQPALRQGQGRVSPRSGPSKTACAVRARALIGSSSPACSAPFRRCRSLASFPARGAGWLGRPTPPLHARRGEEGSEEGPCLVSDCGLLRVLFSAPGPLQGQTRAMAGLRVAGLRGAMALQQRGWSSSSGADQLGELGKGAGKGGGGGGSIREAGGAFGKRQAAEEERYFREKEREQLDALRKHHEEEISHHKKEIERLQKEIERHKYKIKKLYDNDD
uniref:ATPase inhibitor, mitochondrial n=1 Tax=Pelusios castaneus TaxID=367368 RepID=A0A8C8RSV9_9SAUR